ncbi:MAG: NusG domain II-containing protein [Fusobacterium sp.]|nr:NusG domain II-containing protein [Fusobacterium sp.]
MQVKNKYFRIGDLLIYLLLIIIFLGLYFKIDSFKDFKASKAEIWVDGVLKYIYPLQKERKVIFVDTVIGGCNIEFKDNKVRVLTSNSPRKIAVKQGFIGNAGEMAIGIPDRLVLKIVGENKDLDFIIK